MLKQKAINATLWSGADIFLRQGLQFVISIALARLLTPEEFGTIALLYLFVGLAGAFVDSGFSAALIQRQDTTHTDESTVFWFNLAMGAVMAAGLWLLAPWIAQFFDSPILVPLTGVLALNLFLSALGSIHGTLMTKRLDFKTPMKIGAIATSISGALGVAMAWQGYGVWALAMQTLVSTALTTALLWLFSRWRPSLVFSLDSAQLLFGFGGYLLMASLLDITYNRVYAVLIGKLHGAHDLGIYDRAEGTKQLPTSALTSILSRVAFPIFSAASNDKEKLRRGVRIALRGIMLINIPMMLGLMVTAEPAIHVLFGSQWQSAAPILQVLCLAGVLWPLHVINLNVLTAQGHSHLFLKVQLLKNLVGLMLVAIGSIFGPAGVAWSQVAFSLIAFFINAHYTRIHISYGIWAQTMDFFPMLVLASIMAAIVYWAGLVINASLAIELFLQVTFGISFYIAAIYLAKFEALNEIYLIFKRTTQTIQQ